MADEQLYTLEEAKVILDREMRRDMCLKGPSAPGHLVEETVARSPDGSITVWSMRCGRCAANFVPSWPE